MQAVSRNRSRISLCLTTRSTRVFATITGRFDAGSCDIPQPDFSQASRATITLSFRSILPIFGDGLVEIINDRDIIGNREAQCAQGSHHRNLRRPEPRLRWRHLPIRMEGPEPVAAELFGGSLQRGRRRHLRVFSERAR